MTGGDLGVGLGECSLAEGDGAGLVWALLAMEVALPVPGCRSEEHIVTSRMTGETRGEEEGGGEE